MEERVKLALVVVVTLLLAGVEGFLLYGKHSQTEELNRENATLAKENQHLKQEKIDKIEEARKTLAGLKRRDATLAEMVPSEKDDLSVIDFIGVAQEVTGVRVESYAEKKQKGRRGRDARAANETHTWELKVSGSLEQIVAFINFFEYDGHSSEHGRIYSVCSFTFAPESTDSPDLAGQIEIETYSVKEDTRPAKKTKSDDRKKSD